jgi:hypothetical protein
MSDDLWIRKRAELGNRVPRAIYHAIKVKYLGLALDAIREQHLLRENGVNSEFSLLSLGSHHFEELYLTVG